MAPFFPFSAAASFSLQQEQDDDGDGEQRQQVAAVSEAKLEEGGAQHPGLIGTFKVSELRQALAIRSAGAETYAPD
jgi:hypothetical protein